MTLRLTLYDCCFSLIITYKFLFWKTYLPVNKIFRFIKEKHAGFKANPRVKLHFINKLKTK